MAYTRQFKEEAMRLVTGPQGYSNTAAARQLGIPPSTLAKWLSKAGWRTPAKAAPTLPGTPLPDDPAVLRIRLREVEEENRRLKMEKEILKKATAFFAREQS